MNQERERNTEKQARALEAMRAPKALTPRVDIYENEQELLVVADLPGVSHEGLKLSIEPPELRLEGTRAGETQVGFYRAFTIDERIAAAEVSAELKHGVLTVHLPKVQSLKPRQIPIRATS